MEEQLKPEPGGSKLAYFPRPGWIKRIDPWWGLVLVVVLLVVLLVTLQADPFSNILRFVRDGIRITATVTISAFLIVLVLGLFGGLGRIS